MGSFDVPVWAQILLILLSPFQAMPKQDACVTYAESKQLEPMSICRNDKLYPAVAEMRKRGE